MTSTGLARGIEAFRRTTAEYPLVRRFLLLLPALVTIVVLFVVPLGRLLVRAFVVDGAVSIANFAAVFASDHYVGIILRTLRISVASTGVVLVAGYGLAYYVVFVAAYKRVLVLLLFVSMIVDLVVRIYGWMILFAKGGVLSTLLLVLGVRSEPTSLLYTEIAIAVGIIQFCLPLMTLSLVGVLDAIDRSLFEAARNLGASRVGVFRHVTLPLSVDGILAGGSLVFALAMSSFVVPQLLGGARKRMLANSVYSVIQTSGDESLAAALSVLLLGTTLVLLLAVESGSNMGGSA